MRIDNQSTENCILHKYELNYFDGCSIKVAIKQIKMSFIFANAIIDVVSGRVNS